MLELRRGRAGGCQGRREETCQEICRHTETDRLTRNHEKREASKRGRDSVSDAAPPSSSLNCLPLVL